MLHDLQRYIESPYLIGGKKFDIRMYVLCTSFTPLVIWIYRDGFARFSNIRYSRNHLENSYIHLTNHSIQRHSIYYNQDQGCKLSLKSLKLFLMSKHGKQAIEGVFWEVEKLIIDSLISVQPSIVQVWIHHRIMCPLVNTVFKDRHCFELYGYDILLDSELKPWLLEVNASPSLTGSNQEDYDLKYNLLKDLLDVIDVEGYLTGWLLLHEG